MCWAILEIFDKAVCPYQDELSQEIQQKMLNKLNNFFGKNHEQCDTDCLEPYTAQARALFFLFSDHVRTSCNYW